MDPIQAVVNGPRGIAIRTDRRGHGGLSTPQSWDTRCIPLMPLMPREDAYGHDRSNGILRT